MELRYLDEKGEEIIIKNVKFFRKGHNHCEYSIVDGQPIELELDSFWLGDTA